jgi:hypothetical protein
MSIGEICDKRVPTAPAAVPMSGGGEIDHTFGDQLVVTDERERRVAVGV